jgi:protein phosphatase
MEVEIVGKTDVGLQRDANEDSFGILKSKRLVVVCDGMGGHAAGEVASRCAVETLLSLYKDVELLGLAGDAIELSPDLSEEARFLVTSIRIANTRIYLMSESDLRLSGMGTTIVAAVFSGGSITISHVGDSRAYRIRENSLSQLTVDHSLVSELLASGRITQKEAEDYPNRNIITRALGVRERVRVDVREQCVEAGDLFLLCSDGLTGIVKETEILRIITDSDGDLDTIADRLISAANEGGGGDNITCVLARVTSVTEKNVLHVGATTLTVPEERDSEFAAQRIVSDALESISEGAVGNSSGADDADSAPPKSRRFPGLLIICLVAAVMMILMAYVTDVAGTREALSRIFGPG